MGLWGAVVLAAFFNIAAVQGSQVRVEGFDPAHHGFSFANYRVWPESQWPRWAQVAHCTSLVLMARQMFYYARFAPAEPRLSNSETEDLIEAIYRHPTGLPPEGRDRITIPGFSDLGDLSRKGSVVTAIRRVMGNALLDGLRRGWHWTPLDLLRMDGDSNEEMEQYLKETIQRGRLGMLYLARGTDLAHAVLVYGYEETEYGRSYLTYDPNRPGQVTNVFYLFRSREFRHPSLRGREGWVLHPYGDMRTPPYPGWF